MKDILRAIKEFEKFTFEDYVRKRPEQEPTEIYFYLERQFAKCMMRADAFNLHVDPVRKKITGM